MAKRKSAAVETIEPPAQEAAPPAAAAPAAGRAPREPIRPRLEDEKLEILIAPGPDAARMRLLRSPRLKQMQIVSDEELPAKARERLEAAGWTDRTQEEGMWTKQLPKPGPDGQEPSPSRRRMVFDAERLFEAIANELRAGNGLPPVQMGGAAVAR